MSEEYWGEIIEEYSDEDVQSLGGVSYPTIQWVNGDKKLASLGNKVPYTGGWFLPEDQAEKLGLDEAHLKGWEKGEITYGSGDSQDGWFIKDLTVAVICWRRAWEYRVGRSTRYMPWGQYDQAVEAAREHDTRPSGRLRVMVIVKGWPNDAIANLTIRGTNSGALYSALADADRMILKPAARMSKARSGRVPMRMFWLTFGPQRDAKGKPTFTEVGRGNSTSFVTAPTLIGVSDKMDPKAIVAMFVDTENPKLRPNLTMFDSIFRDPATQEWIHAWDNAVAPEEHGEPEIEEQPALVEAEEIPF